MSGRRQGGNSDSAGLFPQLSTGVGSAAFLELPVVPQTRARTLRQPRAVPATFFFFFLNLLLACPHGL